MKTTGSKVLMKDVANDLGVSKSLVSKVLSERMGTSGVSEATAERIRTRAIEMGYQLNQSARALRRGRRDTLGLFLHYEGEPGVGIMEHLLFGINEAAHKQQQKLMVALFEQGSELFGASGAEYSGLVDGVIAAGADHLELKDHLLNMVRNGEPVVTIYTEPVAPEIPNIYTSNQEVGDMAVQHLITQGCKKIGRVQTIPERYINCADLLKQNGLPDDPSRIFDSGEHKFTIDAGVAAAQKILRENIDVDGLVLDSDAQAMGMLNTLLRAGIQVPEQIKLVAISGSPQCKHAMVPITSIAHPFEEKGQRAVEALMQLLKGENPGNICIPPILQPRASTGA